MFGWGGLIWEVKHFFSMFCGYTFLKYIPHDLLSILLLINNSNFNGSYLLWIYNIPSIGYIYILNAE